MTFDVQADLLSFLAQESLAHAALVFATLAAAFTFTTGMRSRKQNGKTSQWTVNELRVMGGITFFLFSVAIYALFRFTFYAALADFALNNPSPAQNETLSQYWLNVTSNVQHPHAWVVPFMSIYNLGWFGLSISIFLAYFSAFLVTLLTSDYLSCASIRLRRTLAVVIGACFFSEGVSISIYFTSTRPYSAGAGILFFAFCWVIGNCGNWKYSGASLPKKGECVSLLFFILAILPLVLMLFYSSTLTSGTFRGASPLAFLLLPNLGYAVYVLYKEICLITTGLPIRR